MLPTTLKGWTINVLPLLVLALAVVATSEAQPTPELQSTTPQVLVGPVASFEDF